MNDMYSIQPPNITVILIKVIVMVALSATFSLASERQVKAGFDCSKATSETEKVICSDERLAGADIRLNSLYHKLVSSLPENAVDSFKNDQRAWLKDRDKVCSRSKYIADCIKDAYDQRIGLFENWVISSRTNRFSESYILNENPSMIALAKIPEEPWRSRERYRFIADFNNDGIDDVALSHDTSMFGNAGGQFFLYLGTADGTYKEIGSFFAHPAAVNLKKSKKGEGLITTYARSNAGSGLIVEERITRAGVFVVNRTSIQPGDFGRPADRKLYNDLFGSGNSLKAELSKTKDNNVTWLAYE